MRRATKGKRLDLWLDSADLRQLDELAAGWNISRQRVIEAALAHAVAGCVNAVGAESYERHQRVILNLDGLATAQIEQLGPEASDGIREALRAFYAVWERKICAPL